MTDSTLDPASLGSKTSHNAWLRYHLLNWNTKMMKRTITLMTSRVIPFNYLGVRVSLQTIWCLL